MKMFSRSLPVYHLKSAFSVLAISLFLVGKSQAAVTSTWSGAVSSTWSSMANWISGTVPAGSGGIAVFVTAPASQPVVTSGNIPISNIYFSNASASTGFTISAANGADFGLGSSGTILANGVNTVANTLDSTLIIQDVGSLNVINNSLGDLDLNNLFRDSGANPMSLKFSGSASIVINGANTFTGGSNINSTAGGMVVVGNDSALGTGTSTFAGATVYASGSRTLANALLLTNGTDTLGATASGAFLILNGNIISNTGATGSLITEATAGVTYTLGGTNSGFIGAINHVTGTMILSGTDAGSAGARWEVDAPGFVLSSNSGGTYQFGSLFSVGSNATGVITTGTASTGQAYTVQIGALNTTGKYAGTLTEAGGNTLGLTKVGTGTQTLSGVSTYTGATNVAAGSLLITGGLSSATAMSVSGSATLGIGMAAGGTAFVSQTVATLNTGANGFESVIKLDLSSGGNDRLITTGAFTLNAEPVNLVVTNLGSFTGSTTLMTWGSGGFTNLATQLDLAGSSAGITLSNFSISGDSLVFTAAAVPEPASWILMGAGLIMLVIFRSKRLQGSASSKMVD